jgi:hypothetical protein
MFTHAAHAGDDPKVVIQATWYEKIGVNPVNGLPQIKPQPNFDSCSVTFLDQCVPLNCVFFPSNPWDTDCDLQDVLLHHSSVLP